MAPRKNPSKEIPSKKTKTSQDDHLGDDPKTVNVDSDLKYPLDEDSQEIITAFKKKGRKND